MVPPQQPADASSSCFLVFDGVGLPEDGLKDWLRLCARQASAVRRRSPPPAFSARDTTSMSFQFPLQTKKPKKTKNDLSPQEMKHIQVGVRGRRGRQHVEASGQRPTLHPSILRHGSRTRASQPWRAHRKPLVLP